MTIPSPSILSAVRSANKPRLLAIALALAAVTSTINAGAGK